MATDFIGNELQVGDLVLCAVSGNSSSASMKFGLVEKVYQAKSRYGNRSGEKITLATYTKYGDQWYRSTSSHDDFRKMCKVSFLQTLPVDQVDKYIEEKQKLLWGKK